MGMYEKKSTDKTPYRNVAIRFSQPMIHHLPHLTYNGNFTVQYVGNYAEVQFDLRLLAQDFETLKSKYIQTISKLLNVKESEIAVSVDPSKTSIKVKINLRVQTNHSSSFQNQLTIEKFQTAFTNAGLLSINSTDAFQVVKLGKNELLGAPISFFQYLFSPSLSKKLGKCFRSPLRSSYEEAQCQYMDVSLWCAMWGLVIIPGLMLVFTLASFACTRNLSLLPLCCFSENKMQLGCLDFFTRVPLAVYSPQWQICSIVLYVCMLVFASCICIIGISSSSQLDYSLVELTSSRRQVLDYPLQRLKNVSIEMERLKGSFSANLTSRNKTLESLRGYLDGDWNRTSTAILGLRSKMKKFALLVEGCKETVDADQCVLSNESLWDLRNLCPLNINQSNSSISARKVGPGIVLDGRNGGLVTNPACKNDDGSNKACPCCPSCEAVIERVDKVASFFSLIPTKNSNSLLLYTADECKNAISDLSELLFNQLKLISTWSMDFFQQTKHLFDSEYHYRTLRKAISFGFWGFGFLTIACLYLSLLSGSQALWTIGKCLILLASLFSWILWGITSVFVVPQEDICRVLLPLPSSSPSSVLMLTLQVENPNLQRTFSNCALQPSSDMWSLQQMTSKAMQATLLPLQLYSRVNNDVLNTLMIANYLKLIEPELQIIMDMQAAGEEFGYSSSYDPSSSRGQAFKLYFDTLQQQIASMQQDVVNLRDSLDRVKLSAVEQRNNFDRMALLSENEIQTAVNEMMGMGSCASLSLVYEKLYADLCEGVRNSLQSVWISLFILSLTLFLTLLFTFHISKHSMQRARDAESSMANLNVMFDFSRYRSTKRFRMAEARLVRDKLRRLRISKSRDLASLKQPESRATINGNVCTVAMEEGVDGWGHESNRGRLPKDELELRVFPEHPQEFSRMEQMMLRGRTEELRLFDPFSISQLNPLKLVSPEQGWNLQYDDRTKALRWVRDDDSEEEDGNGFMTENHKNEIRHLIFNSIQEPQQASAVISKFFYKIDIDGSGTIDERELSKALKALGLHLSPAGIRDILREADRRQNGLLDKQDFLSFVFTLNRKVADAKRARDAQVAGEGEAQRNLAIQHDQDRTSLLDSPCSSSLNGTRQEQEKQEEWQEMTKEIIRQRVLRGNESNDHIYKHQIPEVGSLLGHHWDAQFAEDLFLVCKEDEVISLDEFWGWYGMWMDGEKRGKGKGREGGVEGDSWMGTSEFSFPNYGELQRMRAKKNLEWHRSLSLQVGSFQAPAQRFLDWWQGERTP
eukprot:164615-Hanusia_phi.AAC.2